MALPSTINASALTPIPTSGRSASQQAPSNLGPFKAGSSFYVVVGFDVSGTYHLRVYKADSDDPTGTWTGQDTTNEPAATDGTVIYDGVWAYLDGTTLHIISQSDDLAVDYQQFNTSANTWSVTDETVDNTSDGLDRFCSCSVRSDGDVIAVYQGATDANMGNDFSRVDIGRRESASWTVGISVSGIGKIAEHEAGAIIQRGDSTNDRMHIVWNNKIGSKETLVSTYLNDNTFGHQETVGTTDSATPIFINGAGISFDDGGTIKIRIPIRIVNKAVPLQFDDADDPTYVTSVAASELVAHLFGLTVDGTTQHVLYADDAGQNIRHNNTGAGDDTWPASDNLVETLTVVSHLSSNIYDRSGTKLAYLYNDNGTVKYNELELAAAPAGVAFPPYNPTALHPLLIR